MTDTAQKPPGEESGPGSGQRGGAQSQALFSNLFATRPAKQRKLGPWLVAAVLHIPLLFFFFTSDMGERMLDRAELLFRPVILLDDAPVPIRAPEPVVQADPEPEKPRVAPAPEDRQPVAPLTTPGPPDPTAVPTPGAGAPAVPPGVVPGEGAPRTLLERLDGPRIDPRLIGPPVPGALVTGVESSRDRMAASIAAYNDSVMAERAAEARATDWTFTGKDGKLWGARDGKIYIAGVALPGQIAFAPPPGRRDEINARTRSWADIETQAGRAEIKDSFQDRVKEIRKRKEAERAAAKKKTVTN